jgi:hypothetical protein
MKEIHNLYTLYELNDDGSILEELLLCFGTRPEDWGDPRWHYHQCKIMLTQKNEQYILHCHLWQEVKRNTISAFKTIGTTFLSTYQPGEYPELCGRSHLSEDDYWSEDWGEKPPYYNEYIDDNYWSSDPDLPFNLDFPYTETEFELKNIQSLGACCMCEQNDGTVRNILNLPYRNPKAVGWGCFVCNLPAEGATAIVCDSCLEILQNDEDTKIKWACAGYPKEPERIPYNSLTELFEHKDIPH